MISPKELKNQILELKCEALGSNFEGICRYDGYTLFVDGALPDEIIKVRVEKCKKNYGFAKLLEIIKQSSYRTKPICNYFGVCGGCSSQHIENLYALQAKSNAIKDIYYKNAGIDIDVNLPIHLESNLHCRNKTSLPVREENGQIKIGFFKKRSHDIVDIKTCPVAIKSIDIILDVFRQWMKDYNISGYSEKDNDGIIRHIIVRNNKQGEIMIVIVATQTHISHISDLVELLKEKVNNFVSLYVNINSRTDNVILGEKNIIVYGNEVLHQKFFNIEFEISPSSFMQVNNELTESLYKTAISMAKISKDSVCLDAYSGAGTISLILAQNAKKVYGIEIVKDAVINAKKTASKHNINNTEFIAGKVEEELPKLIKSGIKIDFVMLDPPRKGVESSVIEVIAASNINNVVYISCNPATQSRDVALFSKYGYKLCKLQPVDMFPFTAEVETVALLSKPDVDKKNNLEEKC